MANQTEKTFELGSETNNFVLPLAILDKKGTDGTKSNKISLLYSGNIGDKQDWNSFIEFCNDLDKNRYDVIIVGDGAKKNWVLEKTSK